MSPKFLFPGVIAAIVIGLTGCQKKNAASATAAGTEAAKPQAVELVKANERSRHFLAVSQQLELGGTLYGYADVDGDALKLINAVSGSLNQLAAAQPTIAPYAKQDYAALATKLGLTDIKAVGLSSVPDGTGFFRNRVFFYIPEKRQGLLAGLGGPSAPFAHVNLAPADTDIYNEAEVDLPAVYRTVQDVVAIVGGEPSRNALETGLKKAGDSIALSVFGLINGMKGRMAMVMRCDGDRVFRGPGMAVPAFSLLLCFDGVGQIVEPALAQAKNLVRTEAGTVHRYQLAQPVPIDGISPVLVIDGSTLYLATTNEFLEECRSQKSGLADTPAFRESLARVGTEGNGLGYLSTHLFTRVAQLETLNPGLPPPVASNLHQFLAALPKPARPLVTVRTNLPDGILVRSYWDRSLKSNIAMISVLNPITIGLLSAMAVPAFQKVRTASQEKAVLNNLAQLNVAAERYYAETGRTSALYSDLVGPGRAIKALVPVAGEDYRLVRLQKGRPLQIRMPSNGQLLEYPPAPPGIRRN
jgi:hypothetical protein